MGHFKSDSLNYLMIIIVLFSFISGEPKSALVQCYNGINIYFGLDKPLLACVGYALRVYMHYVLPPNQDKSFPYSKDVNEYYWRMYKLVSADGIELQEQFCKRVDEMKEVLFNEGNPNYSDCRRYLFSFEEVTPEPLFTVKHPNNKQESILNAIFQQTVSADYKLKERILFNALYYQIIRLQEDGHDPGTYGAVYLKDIASKVKLIDGNDLTPRKFCIEKHKLEENDVGTSTSS